MNPKVMNKIKNTCIRQANITDIDLITPLFDAYRVFYGKPADPKKARNFILERFQHNESIIFIALQADEHAVGFTQLYPGFSSVQAARTFILNDLYVLPEVRRSGVALGLLEAAERYGRAAGAINLTLSTAIDNEAAQALYASQGWTRETGFYTYTLQLQGNS